MMPSHSCSWPWCLLIEETRTSELLTSTARAECRDWDLPTGIHAGRWHDISCISQNQAPGAVRENISSQVSRCNRGLSEQCLSTGDH